jgi:hypothetical protein
MRLFTIADPGKIEGPTRPLTVVAEGYGHKPSDGICHMCHGREGALP